MTFYLLVFFAYALGAVPFGLLIGRIFADVDVRDMGSGNIGATNVNRVLGRKLGAATLLCDVLKGILPVLLSRILLGDELDLHTWVGFAAFMGHCYPIYLQFKGGKGVATAFGVLGVISPYSALVGLIVWVSVVKVSKVSALGALVASLVIPFAVFFFQRDWTVTLIILVMMSIVVARHKDNIKRMRSGSELKS